MFTNFNGSININWNYMDSVGLNISEERIHFCLYLFPLDSYFFWGGNYL